MNRITVEEIKAAYTAIGALPTTGKYFAEWANCCCPIGAVYLHRNPEALRRFRMKECPTRVTADFLGLSEAYRLGFTQGFDGFDPTMPGSEDYRQGVEDGVEARRAIFNAPPNG